jgi:hypothetical protein
MFEPLELNAWRETRDTLQKYCRLVGAIREVLSKPIPHSLHTNLLICRKGFTTSSIPKNLSSPDQTFEIIIDLIYQRLRIESNYREPLYIALTGQSLNALCDESCSLLVDIGIRPPLERPSFLEGLRGKFDAKQIKAYWHTASKVNQIMKKIRSGLKGEITPVQLRPDDFTITFARYNNESGSNILDEQQIEFGFSTGDEIIQEAYFYISTFPDTSLVNTFFDKEHHAQFTGKPVRAVLSYSYILKNKIPEASISDFFSSVKMYLPKIKSAKK